MRADVARALLPLVEDDGWFFDTELLVLAERNGLRIHEVPVDWVDDPDSRVDIVATAVADLRGVARLARDLATGRLPVGRLRAEFRRPPRRRLVRRAGRCGSPRSASLSTVAYLALYVLLRHVLPGRRRQRARPARHRPRATPPPTAASPSGCAAGTAPSGTTLHGLAALRRRPRAQLAASLAAAARSPTPPPSRALELAVLVVANARHDRAALRRHSAGGSSRPPPDPLRWRTAR